MWTPPLAAARPSARGRPGATSHAEIERVAFRLFREHGFTDTTLEMIAADIGVGRRTLFRYFESKNDIPWGRFDLGLDGFRDLLAGSPYDVPLAQTVHRAVVEFNAFDPASLPQHRERMGLILRTPALQAHSVLRYAEWRAVIAEHVARRSGLAPEDLLPRTVGQVSLALALASYEAWLDDEGADLLALIDEAMTALRDYLTPQHG